MKSTNKSIQTKRPILLTEDWYKALIEEVGAVVVETMFTAQQTILEGKLQVGKLITEDRPAGMKITELVQYLAYDLKISERELWYCVKFHEKIGELEKLPDFASKAMSWNRVKKLISSPEVKSKCTHAHIIKIEVCEDCGAKIHSDEEDEG